MGPGALTGDLYSLPVLTVKHWGEDFSSMGVVATALSLPSQSRHKFRLTYAFNKA